MRRHAGAALVAAGALTLGWAGVTWWRAADARAEARLAWETRDARRAVLAAGAAHLAGGREASGPGAPVARLRIPRLGLDEVVVEGVHEAALEAGPGHVPSTPIPGARGNSVVSAHRDRHFQRFDELSIGDTITTESDAGRVTWVISARRVVDREARPILPSTDARLTLTTCWPVRHFGPAPDRLVLTARPVAERTLVQRAS